MRIRRRYIALVGAVLPVLFLASCATGPDNNQNTLRPEGKQAKTIQNLFAPIFWIAITVGVAVFIATIFVIIKYRATDKNKSPKQVHGNSVLEIGWTILPFVILIGIAVPTVKTIFDMNKAPKTNAIKVEVVGKQWWWQFGVYTDEYNVKNVDGSNKVDAEGKAVTAKQVVVANELVVPVHRQIDLHIKACNEDTPVVGKTTDELKAANPCNVIHSFWIPSLGGKADAVPGRDHRLVLEADHKGVFTGQCAEYCGLSHGVMRMQVRAVSQSDYDKWIRNLQNPPVASDVAAAGTEANAAQKAIEKFGCTNCHSFDDPSVKSYGPNLTHFGPDYSTEVMGGGSIPKTLEHTWKWIHHATDWENGNGIPMESEDCRLGVSPGGNKICNGMPNFSVDYTYKENGKKVTLPAMTTSEAKAIADYLYKNK
jgi:cytochrome c oxidase subunit 2